MPASTPKEERKTESSVTAARKLTRSALKRKREKPRRRVNPWLVMRNAINREPEKDIEAAAEGTDEHPPYSPSNGRMERDDSFSVRANDAAVESEATDSEKRVRQKVVPNHPRRKAIRRVGRRNKPVPRKPGATDRVFLDLRSHVRHNGQTWLYGEDIEHLRWECYCRSRGRCEATTSIGGKEPILAEHAQGCKGRVYWTAGQMHHLQPKGHGGGFRDDVIDNVAWVSEACHKAKHG